MSELSQHDLQTALRVIEALITREQESPQRVGTLTMTSALLQAEIARHESAPDEKTEEAHHDEDAHHDDLHTRRAARKRK